ncbi:MAG: hypothetical protein ABI042_08085 [Verrucomicrobiota bacterium]
MKTLFTLGRIVASLALGFLCGCSSFNRDWKKASVNPAGIQGRWEGTWNSKSNGHNGALRCLVEKISDESYRARFDSTYKKVLHFKSNVVLNGTLTNDIFNFHGEAKLPWWAGGIYNYEGAINQTNFFSTYKCKYDHGTFQMSRPQ